EEQTLRSWGEVTKYFNSDLEIMYELWNEPNLHEYWRGTAAQMVRMARDAYSIIHGMDPNALVLSPAPTHDPSPWLSDYFAAGGSTAQDIIAYHPFPEGGGGDPEDGLAWVDNTRALMQSYNLDLPIWATESDWQGISTLSNDQEAAWLAKQYILLLYKGVQRNYWYQWDNSSHCTAAWGNLWTGSNGICPAGTAYGQVYSWLAGSTPANPFCAKGADGTWTCDLVLSDGRPARILWNSTTSMSVTAPPGFTRYRTLDSDTVYPVLGNTVSIGNKPIMVTK
ncbi:MAG: cellulase family glycosylhydrolase, partial [Nitrospiraceae bacterium]|nr:cellulase family glycosylhydrolase [Nitrospiraceae bacterium]